MNPIVNHNGGSGPSELYFANLGSWLKLIDCFDVFVNHLVVF